MRIMVNQVAHEVPDNSTIDDVLVMIDAQPPLPLQSIMNSCLRLGMPRKSCMKAMKWKSLHRSLAANLSMNEKYVIHLFT